MSHSSASLSTVKGLSLTFEDFAAFTSQFWSSPSSPPARDAPGVKEGRRPSHTRSASAFLLPEQQQPTQTRHRHSTSSASSTSTASSLNSVSSLSGSPPSASRPLSASRSQSYSQSQSHTSRPSGSWAPTSPKFVDHPPRRLTKRERAALANEPEMDITDMLSAYKDTRMTFEPLR